MSKILVTYFSRTGNTKLIDHGGTVAASSEPGRGTTVTVILPCGV